MQHVGDREALRGRYGHARVDRLEPPRVLVVSGSVGAGHDGAAAELAARLRERGLHVDQRDFLRALPAPLRGVLRTSYVLSANYAPRTLGWMFASIEAYGLMYGLSRRLCALAQRRVEQWLRPGYDVVVSTYPWASQTVGELRASGRLLAPAVTFLTDPAAHLLWVHPEVDHHLTVTQATVDHGARAYGFEMQVGGPLVGDGFWRLADSAERLRARKSIRAQLELPEDAPVALILTGSLGIGDVEATVEAVLAGGAAVPVVACGRNEALRNKLALKLGPRALGWRDDVPDLMAASDVLVTNAGGLSFTEALVAGLPAVSFAVLPGHGEANAHILDAAGLAPWARTTTELTEALTAAVDPQRRHGRSSAPPCQVDELVARLATGATATRPGWTSLPILRPLRPAV
jgi:processive 1,2-diacylglycerol beta-glucosyltransferase